MIVQPTSGPDVDRLIQATFAAMWGAKEARKFVGATSKAVALKGNFKGLDDGVVWGGFVAYLSVPGRSRRRMRVKGRLKPPRALIRASRGVEGNF